MLLVTIRDDLVEINRALDEVESVRDPERRRQRLEQALLASHRVLEGFIRDEDLSTTLRQAQEAISAYGDAASGTVTDPMVFGAFIQAERRLFFDLGLDASVVDRLTTAIREIGPSWNGAALPVEGLQQHLQDLDHDVTQARERIHAKPTSAEAESATPAGEGHVEGRRVLRRVFLVVGGVFVCGANGIVGAAATPVTGGLSAFGAAASAGFGGAMIGAGFTG